MHGRIFLRLGGLLAAVAVAMGALGAHLLKEKLSAEQFANFETALRYQMYHAIALVLVGLAAGRNSAGRKGANWLAAAGWLFVAGILLFSGGLLGWIFTAVKPFVHVVPIGGTLWILAWLCFAIAPLGKSPTAGS